MGRLLARRGEIELDQIAAARRGEQAAPGMETRRFTRRNQLLFPQRMRAGQRGMTAEVDLHDRCEPAKRPSVGARQQESRLRQVHLRADALHPLRAPLAIQKTDCRWIPAKGLVGEGVDLKESHVFSY